MSYHSQTLTDMLCKEIGNENLKLKAKVLSLAYENGKSPCNRWWVSYASNSANHIQPPQDQSFDAVIMTVSKASISEAYGI